MGLLTTFKLPDVGEGLTEAEVVDWHVAVGDRVEINQILVDIETAKSVVELPSPVAGIVDRLHVEEGGTVPVGTALVSIRQDGSEHVESVSARSDPAQAVPVEPEPERAEPVDAQVEERKQVLVGSRPMPAVPRRRHLRPREQRQTHSVIGRTGVERRHPAPSGTSETRIPIKGVRKAMAAAMSASAFTAPHVTEFLTVDVTPAMELVSRLKADQRWEGIRITPLLVVAKAFLLAIREYPEINSSWDEAAQEIVIHHDVNLGIAAATRRGLLVPNIERADGLDLRDLAIRLDDLVRTARSGRTSPADMARGTISLTNIGALGVDAGTPILRQGEAAILAFGAVREMPWVVGDQVVARMVTQLAMSFDHRLVDGELGSHVLAYVGRLLNDPTLAMMHA